jgi:D-2-hydroxyglutarate dehydrogenase
MHFSKSSEAIASMKQIKNLFDPYGILNPYKVLPDNVH